MQRIILYLLLFLFLNGSLSSRENQNQNPGALENFLELAKKLEASGNDYNKLLNLIKNAELLCSGEIYDSSLFSFDDYLEKVHNLNNLEILLSGLNTLEEMPARVILAELQFRTFVAVQHNLERIYWQMPDMQKYTGSVIFATTNKEISQIKTSLLNKLISLLTSPAQNKIRFRTWLALKRMLTEIDIPMSETGNQFVQRSPYGIITRKGELTNTLKILAENETDSDTKAFAVQTVQLLLAAGPKYKDPGRQIVIGAGPEITGLINREALLYFNTAMEKEDHLQKIGYYTKAIELDTNFAAAYFNRAVSSFELNNYEEAVKDFKRVLKVNPKEIDVFPRLGDCYLKTEQYKSAIENYSKALEQEHPERTAILVNRGIAYQKKHEYESAVKDFTDAIELDSVSVSAYNNRAQSLVALKDYNKAINDYEMLIKLRPQNSTYYFNLGCIYWEHKNWQKVNEIWEKGLSINPKDENILKNISGIKLKLR